VPVSPRAVCFLLSGLLACSSEPTEAIPGATPPDSGVAGPGTDPPETIWSAEADSAVEDIAGDANVAPGLCAVQLDCPSEIPDEPKVDCDLQIAGDEVEFEGRAGVELRGRSSLTAPKHQYSIELRDDAGDELSTSLFGMGGESDWVLNGMYYDRALFRNALAYDLFRAMDPTRYAAEVRYCDLVLDGDWLGVFLLTEQVKRDDDRIDIPVDDGTGSSFVLKLDDSGGIHDNALGHGSWAAISPRSPTAEQVDSISSVVSAWEDTAVHDPASLGDHLDLDSWADLVLLEELFKNNDAYYLSLFVWRAPGEPLRVTPWDLDLALGQPSYNNNEDPHSWVLYRPDTVAALGRIPGWDDRLATRWTALREGPLHRDAIHARIDGYQAIMGDSIEANFDVWAIDEIQFGGGYLYEVSSYSEEDTRVRAWIDTRLNWMDDNVDRWSVGP